VRCIAVLYSKPFENFIAPYTTEYRYIDGANHLSFGDKGSSSEENVVISMSLAMSHKYNSPSSTVRNTAKKFLNTANFIFKNIASIEVYAKNNLLTNKSQPFQTSYDVSVYKFNTSLSDSTNSINLVRANSVSVNNRFIDNYLSLGYETFSEFVLVPLFIRAG